MPRPGVPALGRRDVGGQREGRKVAEGARGCPAGRRPCSCPAASRGRSGAAGSSPPCVGRAFPGPGPEASGHVVLQVLFSLPLGCFSDRGCRCVRVRKYRHQRLSFFPAEQPQKRSSSGPLQPPPPRPGPVPVPIPVPIPIPLAGLLSARPARRVSLCGWDSGSPSPPTRVRVSAVPPPPPRVRTACHVSSPLPSPGAAGPVLAEPPPTRFVRPPSLPARSCAASAAKCAGERDSGSKSPDRK